MLSKTSWSTAPVGNGDAGICWGLLGAKSRGIGGNVLPFEGDCDRAVDSSGFTRFSSVPD